jgi:phosphonate transport system permease protein
LTNDQKITALHSTRPRSPFLRYSLIAVLIAIAAAWLLEDGYQSILTPQQKAANLTRFLSKLTPEPLRAEGSFTLTAAAQWLGEKLNARTFSAVLSTFAIATSAILISSLAAFLLIPAASRNLATAEPAGIPTRSPRLLWKILRGLTRALFVITRAVPEYLYAFILVAILGPIAWPLVLALAIHNIGILGRLGSEVIENAPMSAARESIARGGSRTSVYLTNLLPDSFNRFLVYFFYRWETCIREATVLGMLGLLSLGALISDAKVARHFDDMLLYVLLGATIVMLGDFLSVKVRYRLQR